MLAYTATLCGVFNRVCGTFGRNVVLANTVGTFFLLVLFVTGGFVLSKGTALSAIHISLLNIVTGVTHKRCQILQACCAIRQVA